MPEKNTEHLKKIDFHSHILPRMDHGSKSSSDTDRQLKLIAEMGTDTVIATPHFYPHIHNIDDFLKERAYSLEKIKKLSDKSKYGLTLGFGAEVFVYSNMEKMNNLDKLCIDGTKVILLELPFFNAKEDVFDTVIAIHDLGYTVVLAHVDRYYHQYGKQLEELFSLGIKAQLNASGFSTPFGRNGITSHIDPEAIYALGSDLHGYKKSHYTPFVKLQKHLGMLYDGIMLRTDELLEGATYLSI